MSEWKERLERLGRANAAARRRHVQSLTIAKAAEMLEGILEQMPFPLVRAGGEGRPESGRKVSLGRLLRR